MWFIFPVKKYGREKSVGPREKIFDACDRPLTAARQGVCN